MNQTTNEKITVEKNTVSFFFFDIESVNTDFLEMKKAMTRGHYIKASRIANILLENHNNRRIKLTLTREEACLCEIARGIFSFRKKDYFTALSRFGSAWGLAQSDMRIKCELLEALVNTYDGNFKEARRKLKEANAAIILKDAMNNNDSVYALRYECDSVRKILESKCRGYADNKRRVKKTSKLFTVAVI